MKPGLDALLGRFVLLFQAVEEELLELMVAISSPSDPEYVATIAAELDSNGKARALDVMFARFAEVKQLIEKPPHTEFHRLMVRVQNLATRRNDIAHSFYRTSVFEDGSVALERRPTRLQPSKGLREQPAEEIFAEQLTADMNEMLEIHNELDKYRLQIINIQAGSES